MIEKRKSGSVKNRHSFVFDEAKYLKVLTPGVQIRDYITIKGHNKNLKTPTQTSLKTFHLHMEALLPTPQMLFTVCVWKRRN